VRASHRGAATERFEIASVLVCLKHVARAGKKRAGRERLSLASSLILTSLCQLSSGGNNDGDGGGSKFDARYTNSMRGPCNNTNRVENKNSTAAGSNHRDNNYRPWDRHNTRPEIQS